jgi:hypothetical protein
LGSALFTCTDTTYCHYIESKEVDTASFAAKINDIVVLPLPIQAMPVIACQDRLLRPLNVTFISIHQTRTEDLSRDHRYCMKQRFPVFQPI